MKPTGILQFVSLIVVGGFTVVGYAAAATAQTISPTGIGPTIDQGGLARLTADLAYPNSSQRFFQAGRDQFEADIQQWLQDEPPSEPLLTVKPEVLEQFED